MSHLTLQAFLNGNWHDAMRITLDSQRGLMGLCSFHYLPEYLIEFASDASPPAATVSANLPLDWDVHVERSAPAFLHDLVPSGASRRTLLNLSHQVARQTQSTDVFLLQHYAAHSIGHLRVKPSEPNPGLPQPTYRREEIIQWGTPWALPDSVLACGLGANGEAPKLLLAEVSDDQFSTDGLVNDAEARNHWLVKFARNRKTATDRDILRAEYCYYKALHQLGIETAYTDDMRLEEGPEPSLWMRRFDRNATAGQVLRHPVESIYSIMGVTVPGTRLDHVSVLDSLAELWLAAGQAAQIPKLVFEYVRRDLINVVLGNSDNHGRNTSVIRAPVLRLAPIYDLAPMVMDEEGISRSTRWSQPIERGGVIDWRQVCTAVSRWISADEAFEQLREEAHRLMSLPDLLAEVGLPASVSNHPAIGLVKMAQRSNLRSLLQ
ncbi:type II toxin-antitoxin system HipA family toxin [Pseudomonas nitroreducens]|uniref:type II toxin-antitoxin system HipA family toxin n=1 Tax=Pseudomonas nitroreducens TaxID=46680 RepID=UPI00209F80BF|nr:HipA domain-containing protein [Pseudomonas nitroreducens]MCP1626948.1 serine/threonine-protein kinase HipA [Pseudomonas nitroreducens]